MKPSDRYLKIVEWSEDDQCYVGRCPGLTMGGIHGENLERQGIQLKMVTNAGILDPGGIPSGTTP